MLYDDNYLKIIHLIKLPVVKNVKRNEMPIRNQYLLPCLMKADRSKYLKCVQTSCKSIYTSTYCDMAPESCNLPISWAELR
jgi:hypothetical protein